LSKLQQGLGLLAKFQKEYNVKVFDKLEKRAKEDTIHENETSNILDTEKSEDF
jgi:hypothetical protein